MRADPLITVASATMGAVQARHLRFGTWNVHEGVRTDGGRDGVLDEIAAVATAAGLDVLALQEVDFDAGGRSAVLTTITARAGLPHVVAHALGRSFRPDGVRAGIAIASRFPLSAARAVALTNPEWSVERGGTVTSTAGFDKGMLIADADAPFGTVTVASAHVHSFRRFRKDPGADDAVGMWRELAAGVDALPVDRAVFLGGDFNAEDRTLLTRHVRRPLRSGVGGEKTHAGLSIDDVLYPGDDGWRGAARIVDSTFSDHHLCVVELTAPPR